MWTAGKRTMKVGALIGIRKKFVVSR
jgi:hypothetical protein